LNGNGILKMREDMNGDARKCLEHVRAALHEYAIEPGKSVVLVAVSGGPDSICLFNALLELGVRVETAHFDHQTRDGESAEDAKFVRALAERVGAPFHIESRPILEESRGAHLSFEQHAREARYEFLLRVARERGCDAVVTGHHMDDAAETILMRVVRGTTVSGLAGIPPLRVEDGVHIARPLIHCSRNEILAYLDDRGLAYRVDATNTDVRFLRNKIRRVLLPELEAEYNPRVRAALNRLSESAKCENDFMNAASEHAFDECCPDGERVGRAAFTALHPAIRRRVILMLAWRHGVDCPFDRVCAAERFIAEDAAGARFDLGNGLSLVNGRAHSHVGAEFARPISEEVAPLLLPGETLAFGRLFRTSYLDDAAELNWAEYCSPMRQVFDADALGVEIGVRGRRNGDRFAPFGMKGTRKLHDYFVDLGVPSWERDEQRVVVGDCGIAWIVGHAISACVAVTSATRRIIQIEVADAVK
jgi:tRNA(Ile)-lysidine synthase